jgi:hypothetical protein
MLFRASRLLSPEELQQRASDIRHWIGQVQELGIELDPRNLGEFATQFVPEGNTVAARSGKGDAALITLVFFDAADDEQARQVARVHPGPRYGVSLELRDWTPPQMSAP